MTDGAPDDGAPRLPDPTLPPPASASEPPMATVGTPLPPPPPFSPPSGTPPHRTSRTTTPVGWSIAAAVIAVLLVLRALAASDLRSDGVAYTVGTLIGSVLFMALAALAFRRVSRRAGMIAAVVVGGLILMINIAGDAGEASTQRQIDAAAEDLGLDGDDGIRLTRDEARCLDESGFEQEDLLTVLTDTGSAGAAQRDEYIDVVARCIPRAFLTDDAIESFGSGLMSGLPGEVTPEESHCMLQAFVKTPIPSKVMNGTDLETYREIAERCLTPETLAILRGDPGVGPQSIGDDPAFDRLAERCQDGENVACDLLYNGASLGSEYEEIGRDCAGRGVTDDLVCTPGFRGDENGALDAGSPGWAGMVETCRAGDMLACDFIFAFSAIASETERVGETCGERRALYTGETCVAFYGEIVD